MQSQRELEAAGAAALQQIDAHERDLVNLDPEIREHLRTMNEMVLKLSEIHGFQIEFIADATHPHEGMRTGIVMVKEYDNGQHRLVWSSNIHINDLG